MARCCLWLIAFGVLLALSGCSASSRYMTPAVAGAAVTPSTQEAVVVFMRPSSFGSAIRFKLFNQDKVFLGHSLPGAYWEVALPAGEHWFYAHAENTAVMHAKLAPGRRYHVVVRPYMGLWAARAELTALAPRAADWGKREEWLQQMEHQRVDQPGGQAEMNKEGPALEEAMKDAAATWRDADAEWRTAHRLYETDGR